MPKIPFRYLLFIILLVASCKPKEIEYLSLDEVEIVKMGYPRSLVGIKATCYNPNKIGWTLERIDADLSLEGKPMGKVQLVKPLIIAKKDTFQIPLELDIETLQSLKSLARWIGKSKSLSQAEVELKGNALLSRNGISFRYPVSFKGNLPSND